MPEEQVPPTPGLQSPEPVETNPVAAVESAQEALVQIKAAEVQALADVLQTLRNTSQEMGQLVAQVQAILHESQTMKEEIAQTLLSIKAEQEAAKQLHQTPTTQRSGLRNLFL